MSAAIPSDILDLHSNLSHILRFLFESQPLGKLKPSSAADALALLAFLFTSLGYLTRGYIWDKTDRNYHIYFQRPQVVEGGSGDDSTSTRNIAQRLEQGGHDCVIFWGSQSGTAERFAEALARDCHARFGINALVADLSDYDSESILEIPNTYFTIFLLSTYGEGDPSDNTAALWDWLKVVRENGLTLNNLRYLAFGLGNSNYKYYNRVLDVVANALDAAGATALMPRQKADDANSGTEEDFQSWKDNLFTLFRIMGYEQKNIAYQPSISVEFTGNSNQNTAFTTLSIQKQSNMSSTIEPLAVKSARELFLGGDRNCVHLELDLGHSNLGYKTGDHIGIWPCNPDEEVDRLLDVLGLRARRNESITVRLNDKTAKPKLPSHTTLEIAFRNHLEICAPVPRKTVLDMAQFAPTPEARNALIELGQHRDRYEQLTSSSHITLARLLQMVSPIEEWSALPLASILESLPPLHPRYYSISSSSVISPRRIAITALVVNQPLPSKPHTMIHGLTSNYLLSASRLSSAAGVATPTYRRTTELDGSCGEKIMAHVRRTKFKLPVTSSTPLILICAGTGLAPFRAFLQERAKLHAIGKPVGQMILFFGCRNQNDFIYREEIDKIQSQLGSQIEVITAYSRDGSERRAYVQDRVSENADKVLEMLETGANMYICGKASMAREVDMRLEEAVRGKKQLDETSTKAWVDALKKRGKWKADVWG